MERGEKIILGHINDKGDLTIISFRPKRSNVFTKIEYESSMMLVCMCGFGTTLYRKQQEDYTGRMEA